MTKEELEKEAEEKCVCTDEYMAKMFEIGYLAGAEPREKQIEIDAEQIRALQKQNGELTDKVKELEAQIEKMKWHKIADGDIPKVTGDYITNIGVLTYDHYGNNIYKWHTPFCEACDYCDEADADEVIAWCEIPKYTKEIKAND